MGYFFYNMTFDPTSHFDDRIEVLRNRQLARLAWERVESAPDAHGPYSRDYERGFVKGFEDYVYAGGTGEPPPVPPFPYWGIYHQTPSGHRAIEDWYAGFRHGARAARESGYREQVEVPLSRPILPEQEDYQTTGRDADSKPAGPTLHPPRTLPPGGDEPGGAGKGGEPGGQLPDGQ
jgi:hypothetical protein